MIEIEVDVSETLAELKKMKERLEDSTPLMAGIAVRMTRSVIENFENEGRPKWDPLAKSTLEDRQRKNQNGPILQRSRDLYNSITSYHDANSAIVGTNKEYAAIHQFGGEISHPGGVKFFFNKDGQFIPLKKSAKRFMGKTKPHTIKIPARPFLLVTDDDREDILDMTKEYLISD